MGEKIRERREIIEKAAKVYRGTSEHIDTSGVSPDVKSVAANKWTADNFISAEVNAVGNDPNKNKEFRDKYQSEFSKAGEAYLGGYNEITKAIKNRQIELNSSLDNGAKDIIKDSFNHNGSIISKKVEENHLHASSNYLNSPGNYLGMKGNTNETGNLMKFLAGQDVTKETKSKNYVSIKGDTAVVKFKNNTDVDDRFKTMVKESAEYRVSFEVKGSTIVIPGVGSIEAKGKKMIFTRSGK